MGLLNPALGTTYNPALPHYGGTSTLLRTTFVHRPALKKQLIHALSDHRPLSKQIEVARMGLRSMPGGP